jgi:hypothetical protein
MYIYHTYTYICIYIYVYIYIRFASEATDHSIDIQGLKHSMISLSLRQYFYPYSYTCIYRNIYWELKTNIYEYIIRFASQATDHSIDIQGLKQHSETDIQDLEIQVAQVNQYIYLHIHIAYMNIYVCIYIHIYIYIYIYMYT